jgi:very-short-patch-repair endonuclease
MDVTSRVTLLGGACERAALLELYERSEVDAALRHGTLIRTGRGRYAVPTSPDFVLRASSFGGVLSHRSAAQHWGWAQKAVPSRPDVTVAWKRKLPVGAREVIAPHWSDLPDDDVLGLVTTPRRTLVDCMRNLPLDESLPIVDSAIRADDFTPQQVRELADLTRGRGRKRIRDVAALATGKPANAFESVLYAQASLIPGLRVRPQVPVTVADGRILHPDLADQQKRIAVEAEGFQWHGNPAQLTRDCLRYNALTLAGWVVIRFSWILVMNDPTYVQRVLIAVVALVDQPANVA